MKIWSSQLGRSNWSIFPKVGALLLDQGCGPSHWSKWAELVRLTIQISFWEIQQPRDRPFLEAFIPCSELAWPWLMDDWGCVVWTQRSRLPKLLMRFDNSVLWYYSVLNHLQRLHFVLEDPTATSHCRPDTLWLEDCWRGRLMLVWHVMVVVMAWQIVY